MDSSLTLFIQFDAIWCDVTVTFDVNGHASCLAAQKITGWREKWIGKEHKKFILKTGPKQNLLVYLKIDGKYSEKISYTACAIYLYNYS